MKISTLITAASACDVSSNMNFINYRNDMNQIDTLIQQYFELDDMSKRQEQRFERIRERFADKVERITDVAEGLYCKCGAVAENTPTDNLQLISSLSSFGRKKRSSDNLADDLDLIFDTVEAWYEANLDSCSKSQYRLERQVNRMRDNWKQSLLHKLNIQLTVDVDEAADPMDALNQIMSLPSFG